MDIAGEQLEVDFEEAIRLSSEHMDADGREGASYLLERLDLLPVTRLWAHGLQLSFALLDEEF